jgi:hypothetical protein
MPEGDRQEIVDLYKIATDEYRFQVTLNWNRTQYYLGLNVAIIGAGTGILKVGGVHPATVLIACVFAVGLVIALFSLIVTQRQHGYYQAARDRLKAMEEKLELPEAFTLRTTAGMRGEPRKGLNRVTVTSLTSYVFVVLGLIDAAGIVYTATH